VREEKVEEHVNILLWAIGLLAIYSVCMTIFAGIKDWAYSRSEKRLAYVLKCYERPDEYGQQSYTVSGVDLKVQIQEMVTASVAHQDLKEALWYSEKLAKRGETGEMSTTIFVDINKASKVVTFLQPGAQGI